MVETGNADGRMTPAIPGWNDSIDVWTSEGFVNLGSGFDNMGIAGVNVGLPSWSRSSPSIHRRFALPPHRGITRTQGMTWTPGKEVTPMLTIPRKTGESVVIDDIILIVIEIRGDKVQFQIECPREATVHRKEVYDAIQGIEKRSRFGTDSFP
jgi:carbon storage regulator